MADSSEKLDISVDDALREYLVARADADKFDMNDRTLMNGEYLRALQLNLRDKARTFLRVFNETLGVKIGR